MAGSRNDIEMRITADSRGVASGIAPAIKGLDTVQKSAEETETALAGIGAKPVKISLNDQAIENAQLEINRLRDQMRKSLSLDINADTRDPQKRIKALQSSIKALDAKHVVVDVDVDVDKEGTSQLSSLGRSLTGFAAGFGAAEVGKGLLDAAIGASTFETNMRAVNTVLGDAVGTDIAGWIEDNADALNLSQVATSDAARSLSLYATQAEDAGVPAAEFTEQLIRVGAEAAAFSGENPAEAVAAIGAAMRGEFDSLERFGINLTQAKIDAEGLATGLLQSNGEWVDGGKSVAAYNAILEQSGPLMGSIGRNSDTLGGKLADLKQNSADLATALGRDLEPSLQLLADALNIVVVPLSEVLRLRREFVDNAPKEDEGGFGGFVNDMKTLAGGSLGDVVDKAKDLGWTLTHLESGDEIKEAEAKAKALKKATEDADEAAKEWDATVKQAAADSVGLFRDHQQDLKDIAVEVENLDEKYNDLIDSFSTVNQTMIDSRSAVYDYQGAIDDLAESLVDNKTFSPDKEAGRANWDNLVAIADKAGARVQTTLETRGGKAAQAVYQSSRDAIHTMLTDAGIEPQKAWDLVNSVMSKPIQIDLQLKKVRIADIKTDLKRLQGKRGELALGMGLEMTPQEEARFERDVLPKLKKIDAKIAVKTTGMEDAQDEIKALTKPHGDNPKARIDVGVDPTSLSTSTGQIDAAAADRHTTIFVDTVRTGGPTAGPTAGPTGLAGVAAAVLAAPTPVTVSPFTGGGGGGPSSPSRGGPGASLTSPRIERIAPKQTPVAVYLDGVEIAHRIEARRASAATESVRRSA